MTPKFHELIVQEVRRETADTVSLRFEVPAALAEDYRFIQGQYLTLRTTLEGQDIRRSYSICSSPLEGELRVAVKKVEGGLFSSYANEQLTAGTPLQVMTPTGNFHTPIEPEAEKLYLGFAAGSGITPVISIIKTVLQREPKSRFVLFYGNRNTESIIFREELEELKNRFITRFSLYHILSRESQGIPLFYGRIDNEKANVFCSRLADAKQADAIFLCGPEEMIGEVTDCLKDLGVDSKKIHYELFTTPGQARQVAGKAVAAVPRIAEVESQITVILDGFTYNFALNSHQNTVLDGALLQGADLPFACKGGVCCTCRAKVLEGKVSMDLNYALEPDELEAGFVLTCQARPLTERVVITFDEK